MYVRGFQHSLQVRSGNAFREVYLLNVILVNELNFYSMLKFVMELGS